ncbi:MAG TPA: hypothetical protein VLX12_10320 [Syntrophorhabdales bacterium]|nr:hypothetical protein [Syntrophorhabdales bacterium]
MKFRFSFMLLLAILTIGLGGTAFAFHDGGVADCAGCHSMHNTPNANSTKGGGPYLLSGSDQSSTCLNCHGSSSQSSYHSMTYPFAGGNGFSGNVTTVPVNYSPGGDFAWLLVTTTYSSHGNVISQGQARGHSIIAVDYGLGVDTQTGHAVAPGGTFPSGALYCNSCHDPHNKMRRDSTGAIANFSTNRTSVLPIIGSGSYPSSVTGTVGVQAPGANQAVGVYRILAGYSTYMAAGIPIPYPGVPMAIAPSTYNQKEDTPAHTVRVAYGTGTGTNQANWGDWCGACHKTFVSGPGAHYHPVDSNAVLTQGNEYSNYNAYVSSGNMTGSPGTSYLSLVPFVTASSKVADLAVLADSTGTVTAGPGQSDQASCLSCHRAHASGWPHALRWNAGSEFITYVTSNGATTWPGTDTTPSNLGFADGMTSTQVQAAYYGRPATVFGPFQRGLCNKCHAQD